MELPALRLSTVTDAPVACLTGPGRGSGGTALGDRAVPSAVSGSLSHHYSAATR